MYMYTVYTPCGSKCNIWTEQRRFVIGPILINFSKPNNRTDVRVCVCVFEVWKGGFNYNFVVLVAKLIEQLGIINNKRICVIDITKVDAKVIFYFQ